MLGITRQALHNDNRHTNSAQPRSSFAWLLTALLLIALSLRVGVGIYAPSFEYPDEIFESLEPAHHLAFGFGVVTWEWIKGVRSWVFPAFLAGIMRATQRMGPGSSGYLHAIVVVLSIISLTTVWFGFAWGRRVGGTEAGILAAGAGAIWPPLIYFAPKALNEVLAGNLLLPGLFLGMFGASCRQKQRLFVAGFLCGLATSLRIQLAPAAAFAVLYFCRFEWRRKAPPVLAGFALPIVIFGVVDWVTWSYPFQSFARYFWVNTMGGVSSSYGALPWYGYAGFLLKYVGPMLLLALAGVRKSPLLGWLVLIIVVSHSVVPHKEPRFLYPVIPLIIPLAAIGIVDIAGFLNHRGWLHPNAAGVVASGLVFIALSSLVLAWQFPRWNQNSGGLIVMDQLSRQSSVCGVGLYRISWAWTGGYAHLHQNVPIILVLKDTDAAQESPGFNALVVSGLLDKPSRRFRLRDCWHEACLYRREGGCIASPQYNELNKMLRNGYQ